METLNTLKYANRARNIKNKEQTMKFFVEIFFFMGLCHELKVFLRFLNQNRNYILYMYQSAEVLKLFWLPCGSFIC